MSKTALVTGANGFIGRETVRHLSAEGWTVIPAMRHPQDGSAIELDLEDTGFPGKLVCLPRVDAIVHLAAKVDFGLNAMAEIYSANVAATSTLLVLAREWNAKFVFASSALVAGMNASRINAETDANPDTPYAKSKWLAEQLVQASGVHSAILRIGGVYGLDGPEHLGLNRAIKAAASGRQPSQVGAGEARRNYIYVKDVAATIGDVLARHIEGVHLVAGKETLSVADMLQSLCDVFLPGRSPERIEGAKAVDQIVIPSTDLAPSRSFREAVDDMYAEAKL